MEQSGLRDQEEQNVCMWAENLSQCSEAAGPSVAMVQLCPNCDCVIGVGAAAKLRKIRPECLWGIEK